MHARRRARHLGSPLLRHVSSYKPSPYYNAHTCRASHSCCSVDTVSTHSAVSTGRPCMAARSRRPLSRRAAPLPAAQRRLLTCPVSRSCGTTQAGPQKMIPSLVSRKPTFLVARNGYTQSFCDWQQQQLHQYLFCFVFAFLPYIVFSVSMVYDCILGSLDPTGGDRYVLCNLLLSIVNAAQALGRRHSAPCVRLFLFTVFESLFAFTFIFFIFNFRHKCN